MRTDLGSLVDRLRDGLELEPDVQFAYLFGSSARGTDGPLSDVDVAVMIGDNGDHKGLHARHLDLIALVAGVVGSERTDVVILNTAPPALGYRVLKEGVLLFSRDEPARIEHWVRTVDRYLDMEPFRRTLEEGLKHRLEEGRFGRP